MLAPLGQRLVHLRANIVARKVDLVGRLAHSGPQLMVIVGRTITVEVHQQSDDLGLEPRSAFVLSLVASMIMFSLFRLHVSCEAQSCPASAGSSVGAMAAVSAAFVSVLSKRMGWISVQSDMILS